MCDEWEISHERQDLPPHVWQFIKDKGFLGMIIPKQYGASASARSRTLRGGDEALDALEHRGDLGDGAELARAGRAAPARH